MIKTAGFSSETEPSLPGDQKNDALLEGMDFKVNDGAMKSDLAQSEVSMSCSKMGGFKKNTTRKTRSKGLLLDIYFWLDCFLQELI